MIPILWRYLQSQYLGHSNDLSQRNKVLFLWSEKMIQLIRKIDMEFHLFTGAVENFLGIEI